MGRRWIVRWTDDPDEPAPPGELLLTMLGEGERDEHGSDAAGRPMTTNVVRIVVRIRTTDGAWVATHHPDSETPLLPIGIPADVAGAFLHEWSEPVVHPGGRPSELERWIPQVDKALRYRIEHDESTSLEIIAPSLGVKPDTVRGYVRELGHKNWPAYVRAMRERLERDKRERLN